MNKIPATAFLITLNEETNIERALESVSGFDEIIVVDSGSTDKTLTIAQKYTDKVSHQDWLGYSKQKAHALSKCKHEWCFNIDADEVATPELIDEIRQAIEQNNCDALMISIDDRFLGYANHDFIRKNSKPRFFRKNAGRYGNEIVHEGFRVEGKVCRAKGSIIHYGEISIAVKVDKNNLYSSLRAKERHAAGKQFNFLKLILAFPIAFLRSYFFRRALFNGLPGFIGSTINGFYAFLKEAKLFEYQATNDKREQ